MKSPHPRTKETSAIARERKPNPPTLKNKDKTIKCSIRAIHAFTYNGVVSHSDTKSIVYIHVPTGLVVTAGNDRTQQVQERLDFGGENEGKKEREGYSTWLPRRKTLPLKGKERTEGNARRQQDTAVLVSRNWYPTEIVGSATIPYRCVNEVHRI